MSNIKSYLRSKLPDSFVRRLYSAIVHPYLLRKSVAHDRRRFLKYSDNFLMNKDLLLIGNIIKHYHVVEKGLTMPEPRLGFGQPNLLKLIKECEAYIKLFGSEEAQLQHALAVIEEYQNFHKQHHFILPAALLNAMQSVLASKSKQVIATQKQMTKAGYFAMANEPFDLFAQSRSSLRNFSSESIPLDTITAAINLARTTPSACNRQSWRTYIFTEKDKINQILNVQGGNRGFGHLTNKLIVVTGELGVYGHSFERNQVFIDGGMYAMNLLYALHFHKIGACILNCSNSPQKDITLQQLCAVQESEVFIAMIACGIPADDFKVPASPRYEVDKIIKL